MRPSVQAESQVSGKFIDLNGERFYAIYNVDQMPAFFISLISDSDHWMFLSSNTGLSAGRVSPETALFTYQTVDRIHESHLHTGCKTIIKKTSEQQTHFWEPFNQEHDDRFSVSRNLYKNLIGNKICYEEINHDLQLTYRYTWASSEQYGFVRSCELINLGSDLAKVEVLDGFQNVLPAGTPRFTQTNSSNLVDAYKWTEVDPESGLGIFSLYSAITDRAEPVESLNANTVFCLGLNDKTVLLSSTQVNDFKRGKPLQPESIIKGIRGAYLVNFNSSLGINATHQWQFVTNIEQSQAQVVNLQHQLEHNSSLLDEINDSITFGTDNLAKKMAAADGFQLTNEEDVSGHHYANVLFNVLRGGIFDDQYQIPSADLAKTIQHFNTAVFERHQAWLENESEYISLPLLQSKIAVMDDPQLQRLVLEYLPITFGRRHGDPSRPWNQFEIKLHDEDGNKLLSYQGNWRDIFQNWEALAFSYPEFIESVIAKFVNASTVDGYNPYRITKDGIDWEVEDPEDPWSYIGYWGDHQIIYLQKLLELSYQFHPAKLTNLLRKEYFSYANVPYRIKSYKDIKLDAKSTVLFDHDLAETIEQRVTNLGADGKLVLDSNEQVYQVNLLEKLCVTLLTKLGNTIIGGGVWLNTQRPEWNDANNALVGQGLSVVTLCYMRRYTEFLQSLLANEKQPVSLSSEVADWLINTSAILSNAADMLNSDGISHDIQLRFSNELGQLASDYRQKVYARNGFSGKQDVAVSDITRLLTKAQQVIDHTLAANHQPNGLFHAYNLMSIDDKKLTVDHLYPMLEGQVAALSSGFLSAEQTNQTLDTLFTSDIYRDDQKTFMLYPDRKLPSFLQKNRIDAAKVEGNELLMLLLETRNSSIIQQDDNGEYRFNSHLTNSKQLVSALSELPASFSRLVQENQQALLAIYEEVFNHKAFTGRSGGMFGFEGLGSIYWHMVSKLLLAVQESYFRALEEGEDSQRITQLAEHYYAVREGIGFNKTPSEYGAFPLDPYSHTPKHSGAQQPGMTGQVKEEVLTRFGELGIRVTDGMVKFQPSLLRQCEFISNEQTFKYLDVNNRWQTIQLPANALAFTWCQVPVVYQLSKETTGVIIATDNGKLEHPVLELTQKVAESIFNRDGFIKQITLHLTESQLSELQ